MPWLTAVFSPGFAEDLTFWEMEIERDGQLRQTIHIRPSPREMQRERETRLREVILASDDIAELDRLIEATDFAAVAALPKVDDVPSYYIKVEGPPEQIIRGSLDYMAWEQRDGQFQSPDLADAVRLWNAIERLAPYRLPHARIRVFKPAT